MSIPNEIIAEFGLPDPNSPVVDESPKSNDLDLNDTSDGAIEDRILKLWPAENRPVSDNKPQPVIPQPQTGIPAQQQPANGQQAGGQQQAAPVKVDPVAQFGDSSKKAFFTESGELDSQKMNDYFLTNGKSFLKYAAPAPDQLVGVTAPAVEPEKAVDPAAEYREKAEQLSENFDSWVGQLLKEGKTEAEAMQLVSSYAAELKKERDHKIQLRTMIEDERKKMAPEFEQAKLQRAQAKIESNVSELSQNMDGLIPGMNGRQVLNQIILNDKYGGGELKRQFDQAHPDASKLPEAEKNKIVKDWFDGFQQDKSAMAHVAEYGRMRWQIEQFPALLEYAQSVGAQKVNNSREAAGRGVSSVGSVAQAARGNSAVEQFFGMDSVN